MRYRDKYSRIGEWQNYFEYKMRCRRGEERNTADPILFYSALQLLQTSSRSISIDQMLEISAQIVSQKVPHSMRARDSVILEVCLRARKHSDLEEKLFSVLSKNEISKKVGVLLTKCFSLSGRIRQKQ